MEDSMERRLWRSRQQWIVMPDSTHPEGKEAPHAGSLPVIGCCAESVVTAAVHAAVVSFSFVTVRVPELRLHLFRRKRRALRTLRLASPVTAVQSRVRIASAIAVAVGGVDGAV